jgi:ribonuclease HII
MKHTQSFWEIGIDEAGRGPLAGPVAVGVVLVPDDFDWDLLAGVTDSKLLSEARRECLYKSAKKLEKRGLLYVSVVQVSAKIIDRKGINTAVNCGIARGLEKVQSKLQFKLQREKVMVKLDGGLWAPPEWVHQETIIKGDAKEKVIGLASIMAKVTRDRYMRRRATLAAYTPYDFARHKGYGTKAHRAAIATHGPSPEHRRTFCKNIKGVV